MPFDRVHPTARRHALKSRSPRLLRVARPATLTGPLRHRLRARVCRAPGYRHAGSAAPSARSPTEQSRSAWTLRQLGLALGEVMLSRRSYTAPPRRGQRRDTPRRASSSARGGARPQAGAPTASPYANSSVGLTGGFASAWRWPALSRPAVTPRCQMRRRHGRSRAARRCGRSRPGQSPCACTPDTPATRRSGPPRRSRATVPRLRRPR